VTDLESEIRTLRELDTLRVESGKLRDEGVDTLIALFSPLFRAGDMFVWGKVSPAITPLLANSPSKVLRQRQESALIQELNKILQGDSIYESARFTGATLRPETSACCPFLTTQGRTNRCV
jgi:hypothetical protein